MLEHIFRGGKLRAGFVFLFVFYANLAFAQEAPLWVTRQAAVYPPDRYLTGTGEGRGEEEARTRALAQISRFFQTTVEDTQKLFYSYRQTLSGSDERSATSQQSVVTSEADFFGVRFAETYFGKNGAVRVLAYIDREAALEVYDLRTAACLARVNEILKRYENSPHPMAAIPRLQEARESAALAEKLAGIAVLINPGASDHYRGITAILPRVDSAIAASKGRLTASVNINDERFRSLAHRAAEAVKNEGFALIENGGVYTLEITVTPNESKASNNFIVQPEVAVVFKAQDGSPVAGWRKAYAAVRHPHSADDAVSRALRAIEQNVNAEFPL
ncbi:MAG: LPP20 family lipoprotein, partial [Treponema sp.]|nr:LPP20 family lipoprotein [Treponema sp.]